MKISNFKVIYDEWDSCIAEVCVTTSFLLWKRMELKVVKRDKPGCWYFSDTGEWTPAEVMALERVWRANNEK